MYSLQTVDTGTSNDDKNLVVASSNEGVYIHVHQVYYIIFNICSCVTQ